ncbi:enoyl-CoA hydratase/isomerase family protein [Microbacterium esteraromaticum]|uniref:Enoyl-CoA hydratase/isomerase family protein n=1 Tax=Microbacterium esteraromaticum TaxID=57043 RepID=A0A939DU88_9MICO|nr:enoyl-CoA hydratase/isomerase family protein [Microbacterium esteraromaticum]MBN8205301.1 enoyl-CoA hydratase/isomerase family protein [Microbacterium esteraromaticum]MBN8415455.1 enoyl-CoA hydratase/isomerase family protein [Microbacterium esteraromaticum]
MSDPILFTVDDGLARLTLNRPASLNAFDADLAMAWRDVTAAAVGRDDVRAILLDAAGRAFCAGGDVVAMATTMGSGADITSLAHVINEGILSLTQSAIPVVAAAHGTTAGGGLGILMCSDYAVVGASSKIGSLYANIGLTPDLSVSAQLARAVGERRALQLVLQDRLLSAEEAVEWGLVAEAVAAADADAEADAVRARAEQIARFWLAGAAGAYGQAKRLVRSQPSRSFAEQLAEEARSIGAAFETADAKARVAGFAASRTGGR